MQPQEQYRSNAGGPLYINFVGNYLPRFGEEELTPEAIEERKESEKRLRMNVKVEEIRHESIRKSVFIPVSALPMLEPKIGKSRTDSAGC